MSLLVQKFGGTSVGDLDRIRAAAEIISKARHEGHQVVVVVSAMNGSTDEFIQLAHQLTPNPQSREWDALLATGEQVSAALLSMQLNQLACSACSYNAMQLGIKTEGNHRKAKIVDIELDRLVNAIEQGITPVVTGFQGVNEQGDITTIGRGGSDTTAVWLAAKLAADECQIYTDVDGVFTSDPRIVQQARCLNQITFAEMHEFARLGAKVFQTTAVSLAERFQVPIRILSSFREGQGTLITRPEQEEGAQSWVSGIAFDRNQAKLTLRGLAQANQMVEQLWTAFKQAAIEVDMLIHPVATTPQSPDFSFTVPLEDYQHALSLSDDLIKNLTACEVIGNERIAKLSLVGVGMKTHAGVASKMFHALGAEGIEIQLITSSEAKISAVIDEKYMELGARTLHSAFGLDIEK